MYDMIPIIDMHCDTISAIHNGRLMGKAVSLCRNDLSIDLNKLSQGGYMCQNFALFTNLGIWNGCIQDPSKQAWAQKYNTPFEYCLALSDTFDSEISRNSDLIRPVLTTADILENHKKGYISALKTIEEGDVYAASPDNLKKFYDKGVRMTTLTWNFENSLAFPNRIDLTTGEAIPETENGLKEAAYDILSACMELGIIIDISHLGDAGIWEILDITHGRVPIAASHSNARAVTAHPRNLTDEMIRRIADQGGVVGINFCDAFMNDRNESLTKTEDIINHVKHIRNIGGIDVIGMGTDFDGISNRIDLGTAQGMQKLAHSLEASGFTTGEIEKIFYKNVLRVYNEVL